MSHATLLIVTGPNRGARFDVEPDGDDTIIGRSVGTRIRVDDTEMSRRHARVFYDGRDFRLQDLNSANGTYVNGRRQSDVILHHGDSLRLGNTRLTFQTAVDQSTPATPSNSVHFVDDSKSGQHSAIIQQLHAASGSSESVWPDRRSGLELLYQVAEELVHPTHATPALLHRILCLTLDAVRADRGCILLRESTGGELTPIVFHRRGASDDANEQMPISRTITGYVLQHGKAVRTSDASVDTRFDGGNSILSSGIREAICAPMRGQEELIGVIYLDITTHLTTDATVARAPTDASKGRLTDEHLRSVLAVARQSALAVEARRFHDAFLKAERFAAMGQTITVLSHHIKNILQGVKGGGFLIQTGLDKSDEEMIRQGWGIIERNQNRINQLVMDMLSFSKERMPVLKADNLNKVCEEVAELARTTASENDVSFEFRPGEHVPLAEFDHEGIHRAVLNIVINAIDAVSERDDGIVVLQTSYDRGTDVMLVAVTDNGPGIPKEQRQVVFNVFESSKGSRGTGIGLPVSRKIIREHGGKIKIEGAPGEGTRFVLSWPRGNPKTETIRLDGMTEVSD
ncbi:ATP-binding protein [Fuerstiella marisgermanici]|uniref:histidine kinase n=1 Tax=Fuerstiella marisgermanici TaxID=1891926 RepID=A0A1P8WAP8_9PLAN|nr:ATP-binding protein [Fuerstiella marisgermanici]APZ91119.1 Sensor protein ZraS [Fuerstiella marisgermanici]